MTPNNPGVNSQLRLWLTLERIPRVGPLTIAKLIDAFGSPEAALTADRREIRRRCGLNERLCDEIAGFQQPVEEINKDIKALERIGARVITRWDDRYPHILREIYDPPALLFVRGELDPDNHRAVAIVGTRNPTRYGIDMARSITRDLVRAGVTIVSGLARGIDTACHRAALDEGGRTVGVLGCGVDKSYPRENKELTDEIARTGAVITEFRPGVPPLATNFYRRNRIVSGLTRGVVVVEAGRKSGSLITAAHALDQNREVFAVPGNVMNLRTKGPHQLLKEGAGLVESGEDIVEALFSTEHPAVQQPQLFTRSAAAHELSEPEERVLEAIDPDPIHIDIICESTGMDVAELAGILLDLELKGLIRQNPGKMFARGNRSPG